MPNDDKRPGLAPWIPEALTCAASVAAIAGYLGVSPSTFGDALYPFAKGALFAASVAAAFVLGVVAHGAYLRASKRRALRDLNPKLRRAMLDALIAEDVIPTGEYDSLVEISARQDQGIFIVQGVSLFGYAQNTGYTLRPEWFAFLGRPRNRKLLERLVGDAGHDAPDDTGDSA